MLGRTLRTATLASKRRALSSLVVAEHDGKSISEATLSAVTACAKLGPTTVLIAGDACQEVADSASAISGVDSVAVFEGSQFKHGIAEEWAPLVTSLQKSGSFSHIVGAGTSFNKALMPRVAAMLDVAQLSDVTEVCDESTFVRPIYAGNALLTVQSQDAIKVLTVRPTAFEKAATEGGSATVSSIAGPGPVGCTTWMKEEVKKSDRPELAAAKVVISGGRGLKTGENFALLDSVALKLDAAVGASRAAVDSGMCPNDMQVGQTGKVVAPDLYIAVGISGAIQHLAGMKDSKTIVAINKDPEAPIFQVADYGLVEDLFKAVPEFDSMLAK